jgi:hypothetical protein
LHSCFVDVQFSGCHCSVVCLVVDVQFAWLL